MSSSTQEARRAGSTSMRQLFGEMFLDPEFVREVSFGTWGLDASSGVRRVEVHVEEASELRMHQLDLPAAISQQDFEAMLSLGETLLRSYSVRELFPSCRRGSAAQSRALRLAGGHWRVYLAVDSLLLGDPQTLPDEQTARLRAEDMVSHFGGSLALPPVHISRFYQPSTKGSC